MIRLYGWLRIFAIVAFMSFFCSVFAGTIMFKDGKKLTKVKIVKIQKGRIYIEKDGKVRGIPFKELDSYSSTDMKGGGDAFIPGDFADYSVSIYDVDMPKRGEDSKGKRTSCDIKYSITRKGGKKNKAPVPYFYLFVLTSKNDNTGGRKMFTFSYPKKARIKSKIYDKAAILDKLTKLDRKIMHFDQSRGLKAKGLGTREIEIELKKVKERYILAYHLEVWGIDSIVAEKTRKIEVGTKISKKWWENRSD